MFDISPDDISLLNDSDLRELVGRLCEAELVSHGRSAAAVTWGGNQTAADGGLDVRVALISGEPIDGFIPRNSVGFQVKTPDMPRTGILAEMRPAGTIRPVIQELADEGGAYIIVSSNGSTSDSALRNRREALREALDGLANADQLHTDFYDRTRLATWVRRHPGLITWVKEKVGKALAGWRPYGPWSGTAESADAEYLLDDKLRLHLGRRVDEPTTSVADAIDELRDELAKPRKIVRLVGLSGVGKTRLVQALFDARIGARPLPPSHAIYTNLSDNPDPQPIGLVSDLIANGTRAVLIVDNCPPDLHRRLSELCCGEASSVSILTVEYDVRDDQPEGTQVVTLDTSSPELIEKLVRRRYPHVSQVDARTIAEFSGGNARIAIALAETVERSESIMGLSNEELFQRLFLQRHGHDNALLHAAKACSLVYSFQGESLVGADAELPRLASLAGHTVQEIYRHVGELLRRDLAQQRGSWRAILPHAIANRLAASALDDIPYDLIEQQLINDGTERLARSFSRRLSFLHDHSRAIAVVGRWLTPGGILGDVATLNDLGRVMFENVAPVLPEAALAALERVGNSHPDEVTTVWRKHLTLLRSLAYEPPLFERCAHILVLAATQSTDKRDAKEASDIFVSLFTIFLSGTHATLEQRLAVIEQLLRSDESNARSLGLDALDAMLEATHFSSSYLFEFGAHSRDFGYEPQNETDVTRWYSAALELIERLALDEGVMTSELRAQVSRNFRGLWTHGNMIESLEHLFRRFASESFWREGWAACRTTAHFDRTRLTPENISRLSALEAALRPSNLKERVQAMVLGDRSVALDLEDMDDDDDSSNSFDRLESIARELGAAVAKDNEVFEQLLPELLRGGNRLWSFGCGLASESSDPSAIWTRLIEALEKISSENRDVRVLMGILSELWNREKDLAQNLLDLAVDHPTLTQFFPVLCSAVELDERGAERLTRALNTGRVPIGLCRNLAYGRTTDHLPGNVLKNLLLLIANQPDGFNVSLHILYMRLHSDRSSHREHEPGILEAGRELLQRITFESSSPHDDYELADIVKSCLTGPDASWLAAEIATRLKDAATSRNIHWFDFDDLLNILLDLQPNAALEAFFSGDDSEQKRAISAFERFNAHRRNPVNAISCEALIAWCEGDRDHRYAIAASIIILASREEATGDLIWSEQAKTLLVSAPSPATVLDIFITRFRPMSWSGSRAALIEANSRLLDNLDSFLPPALMPQVENAKAQLAQDIADERKWELDHDRVRDERFE